MGSERTPRPLDEGDPELERFFLQQLTLAVARQMTAQTPQESIARAHVAFALFLDCLLLGLHDAAHAIIGCLREDALLSCRPVA